LLGRYPPLARLPLARLIAAPPRVPWSVRIFLTGAPHDFPQQVTKEVTIRVLFLGDKKDIKMGDRHLGRPRGKAPDIPRDEIAAAYGPHRTGNQWLQERLNLRREALRRFPLLFP
jgi:hypothetical protein